MEKPTSTTRYLEDFAAGQTFGSGRLRIDKDPIKEFAREFDPQPFHLDDEAAGDTIFRGLAASGWRAARGQVQVRDTTLGRGGDLLP